MRLSAWAAVTLGLLIAAPAVAQAQDTTAAPPTVQLHRNYPNPFNPETTIPFSLDRSLWSSGRPPVVSLRIYNILAQLVAVPILQGTGELLDNVSLVWNGTGDYAGYWDGKVLGTNREAASGVYVYQLTVNGKTVSKKMTIVK
ncbi:MAG: hypothetical protein GTN62_01365 [Gemmatimonadales bacterium]|nr:hypothetical protein [Gemmatimonadales bacterium]NIN12826.1 hypothetical protein [Gemmatimonadales bacterium]NIN48754.1 hypothetical protein [Gemmatimonadales bacterium]NIP06218.1 hypothetical protein [Gemmatimonadales bacterium]NIR01403.1 hypothetical protein [Gemmatimonadales bacterium]